jgi:uncharacterized protein
MTDASLELHGEVLRLMPERALHLPGRETLLVADVHIGKSASFRALGVPVPGGTTAETLTRLDAAIARSAARTVVFLGDFLHSRLGRSPATLDALSAWRARHPDLALVLVRGNHDLHAGDPPAALGVRTVDDGWRLGPFVCRHAPESADAGYVLAGHLHPAVTLRSVGDGRLRLPCFHFGAGAGVLPAFGAFTGTATVTRLPTDRVFAVADDRVLEVPPPMRRGRGGVRSAA